MKDMGPKTAEMNRHLGEVSSTMIELVAGIKVVKAFSKTGKAHQNYASAAEAFSKSYWDWCAPLIGLCSIAGELISAPLLLFVNFTGAGTGIHSRVTPYIKEEIWSKFRLNVCNNLPQAILGAGVGCYSDSAHIKAISDGLSRELEAIAAAKGIDLSIPDGAFVGITGAAGSGKSTLTYALNALFHVTGSGCRAAHRN